MRDGNERRWRHRCKVYTRFVEVPVNEHGLTKRDEAWLSEVRRIANAKVGPLTRADLVQATLRTDGNFVKMNDQERALRKADRKTTKILARPQVQEAIREAYSYAADFTPTEAIRLHVQHIRDGNYQALKDYQTMAMPQPAKKVQVQQQTSVLHASVNDVERALNTPPQMAPRAIGSAKVEHDA